MTVFHHSYIHQTCLPLIADLQETTNIYKYKFAIYVFRSSAADFSVCVSFIYSEQSNVFKYRASMHNAVAATL